MAHRGLVKLSKVAFNFNQRNTRTIEMASVQACSRPFEWIPGVIASLSSSYSHRFAE